MRCGFFLQPTEIARTGEAKADRDSEAPPGLTYREPTGKARQTVLSLPAIGKKIKLNLAGFEIKTLRINPKSGKYTETNLLEVALRR